MADIVELRLRSAEAREAYSLLKREAEVVGLRLHYPHSAVVAVEFEEVDGRRPFSATANNRHLLFYLRQPILQRVKGLFARASARFGEVRINHLGEYRARIHDVDEMRTMLDWLGHQGAWTGAINGFDAPELRNDGRLPAAVLDKVTAEHLLVAARMLAAGFGDHDFSESTSYEVEFEGVRLKPKALFGVAATRALGFRVKPAHFSGGIGTQCFRKIESAGYPIVLAGAEQPPPPAPTQRRG